VLKVDGTTPPKLKPLDSVRAQVTAAWTKEQVAKILAAKAKELTAKANAEKSLAGVAAALGVKPQASGAIRRGEPSPIFAAALVRAIFSVKGGQTVYGPAADGNGYVIAQVTGVYHPPLPVESPMFKGGLAQLSEEMSGDLASAYSSAVRQKAGVTINQKAVDSALGEGS